ncbi:MAG: CHAT domain-containing protein [Thermoanaerobaculia bacterium]|nr:CHAT domain-containing protein [Thermoanaerobaculia bacterium]
MTRVLFLRQRRFVLTLVTLGLAVVGCERSHEVAPHQAVLERLAAAPTRPFFGRLADSPHKPHVPRPGPKRGGGGGGQSLRGPGATAGSWLNPAQREARALEWLVAGHLEDAVAELVVVSREWPEEPRVWNHLAVARLEAARRQADPAQALMALGAADQAQHLASSPEGRWNRALALALIPLPRRAEQAWQEAAAAEADGWAVEGEAVRAALPRPPPPRLAEQVTGTSAGRVALREALEWRRSEHRDAAAAAFARARQALEREGDALALRARLGQVQSARRTPWPELGWLLRATAGRGDGLEAAVLREAGFRHGREGRTEAAVSYYRRAEERYLALGQEQDAAVAAALLAELYAEGGDEAAAWSALGRAFARSLRVADPLHRYSLLVIAAYALRPLDAWAAVEVRSEAAEVCQELPERPLCFADSAIAVAGRWRELGARAEPVEAELARARAVLEALEAAPEGRRQTLADLEAETARWRAAPGRPQRDLDAAVAGMKLARDRYAEQGRQPLFLRATDELAGWLFELGREDEAEALLSEGRALLRGIAEPARVLALVEPARSVYQRSIETRLARGADAEALAFVEELRSLPFGNPAASSPDLAADSAAVVYWRRSEVAAVAWLVTTTGALRVDLPDTRTSDLTARLEGLPGVRQVATWNERTAELHERWLAPVLAHLPPTVKRLLIVPDGPLANLPFRALWNPRTGRYLDDDFAVELVPRLGAIGPAEVRGAPLATVFAVGQTQFAPILDLAPLASTGAEVAALAREYPAQVACDGHRWADFRACAPRAEVIHLATHARFRADRPGEAWIAFSDQTVSLDTLRAELPKLPHTRLVVLSACQSGYSAGGIAGGLAPPFLAAGAERVVGSLWPVEDSGLLAEFMAAFHAAFRRSGNAAEALREARGAHPDLAARPWLWGAFTLASQEPTGGSSERR